MRVLKFKENNFTKLGISFICLNFTNKLVKENENE